MSDHSQALPDGSNFHSSGIKKYLADKVVLTTLGLLAASALISPDAPASLAGFTIDSLWEISIFILISVLLAGAVKASGADATIAKALSGRTAIFTAAAFGALSPFCSCGVVPLIAALLAAGVPLGPVMAFWLASPVIDPEMFILTWGVLGPEMAIAKMLSAIALGLLGGSAVVIMQRAGGLRDPLRTQLATGGCGPSSCAPKEQAKPVWAFWNEAPRRDVFKNEIGTMGWFLFKWLTLAFVLEAMMLRWAPIDTFAATLADMGVWAVPAAAVVGVPAYLNGYAAIPLVRGLMDIGLEPGAALAFMVAGGVTCIPAAVAVKALVKTPVFLMYLALALTGSIMVGIVYGGVFAIL